MNKYKTLHVGGALLNNEQLESYLQKLAVDQILKLGSDRNTYPVPRLKENLNFIYDVYSFLSEDLKNKIPIHPAGEWILDNFYIIEKNAKIIIKNLSMKKYRNLVGIANGTYKGFSRVYVLAKEIVSYTDGKFDGDTLERFLCAYQNKKTLSMEELWSINTFLQIALIEKIRSICEKIYLSQMQKRKVENIIGRLVEFNQSSLFRVPKTYNLKLEENVESKYPFIEYMSYRLKKYGKKAYSYLEILEDQVNKMGSNIYSCINREHFDIAAKKVSIGNSITSINTLNRLNFVEIFNKTNGVEEVLKNDPCGEYALMDYKTKEYYRAQIERIAKKTKISEIYIAKKCLELAKINFEKCNAQIQKNCQAEESILEQKKSHVGYYLISDGKEELYSKLLNKKVTKLDKLNKAKIYILGVSVISIIICSIIGWYINNKTSNFMLSFLVFLLFIVPIKSIVTKIIQYFSGKLVKPKLIPKLDFSMGIPEKSTTMVVIPTIVKDKEKVKEIMKNLEVFYMANKSPNLYFTLLGDCSSSKQKEEPFDDEVVKAGIEECNKLNIKYVDDKFPKFNFIYRKRTWCESEGCYLGWERKRGLLTQFNNYILENNGRSKVSNLSDEFVENTLETAKKSAKKIPNIKYIITLDSDTNLVLNTGFELVGAMSHILNKPVINSKQKLVTDGYALIQPRVGINLQDTQKSNFTKIFSGLGGTDSYTNAISDFYFDNFDEGIFTGKGIYDLEVFSDVLENEIPENTVLSHDLLEGSYARCGLASDIMLMDGYPSSYNAYKTRLHRWIRGDWQILSWMFKNRLNILSKYKILDNINRSLNEFFVLILLCVNLFIRSKTIFVLSVISVLTPYIIEFFNRILNKKNGEFSQKKFSAELSGISKIVFKMLIDISLIPDKAYLSVNAGIKSIYRILRSKKHLLEWTTAEDAEKLSKNSLMQYALKMVYNLVFGILFVGVGLVLQSIFTIIIGVLWIIAPAIMNYVSKPITVKKKYDELSNAEKEFVLDIGKRTWMFFKENMNEKSNFLPPDNYQESRKEKIVYRTSPTNIGLALLSVIASYDLGFENREDTINLLEKMLSSIEALPKWNGHLYNWYNIENLTPLIPRYISSVDSGNFVGYLYVLKQFLLKENDSTEKINFLINLTDKLISNTDFSKLFDIKTGLFSIGFNLEENKLTDSYYDLLASEARQTSIVAIAKKDISSKHWKNLSRTLTVLNKYKGLVSWSGTAFEYLMPSINIKRYPNSLLDESCKFMIMSQIEYAKKLGITWGISEAAFNLKDLNGNYQYKAFGIPWLGLKRGLAEEMVVSSYGTILAINDVPKQVIDNIKELQQQGMLSKYGFYESIDYTPGRVKKGQRCSLVKTYMAHHQGLILLSIDNLVRDNILQKRFFENPEIEAIDILLQERMPDNVIITKEKKEHVEKIKYVDYDYYSERIFDKRDEDINEYNLISNNNYSILIDKNGNGYSKYKDYMVNRFKYTDDVNEGIHFLVKDVKSQKIWSPTNLNFVDKLQENNVIFYPDKCEYSGIYDEVKTTMSVVIAPEEAVEIRNLNIKNLGDDDKVLEVSSMFEPVISSMMQDYSHKTFNNLFLSYEMIDDVMVIKRKFRNSDKENLFLAVTFNSNGSLTDDIEYEIDKRILYGRNSIEIPDLIKKSKPFSKKIEANTTPVAAFRISIQLEKSDEKDVSLIISVSENKDEAIKNVQKYKNYENIERAFKLSRAQVEAKIQYLGITGKDVNLYQRILSHLLIKCGNESLKIDQNKVYKTSELWKYGISGDNPILLVYMKNVAEIDVIKKVTKACEYYQIQNINVDLVVINEEPESYENYLQESINEIVWNYKNNGTGRIYVLNNLSKEDKDLLRARANLVLNGGYGKIEYQLDEIDYECLKTIKNTKYQPKTKIEDGYMDNKNVIEKKVDLQNLKFYNEYGGFRADGKEYIININKENKLPLAWSNILANDKFGTVVTENMGGYTWYKNSRLNRITAWNNDPVRDIQPEIIYFSDKETGCSWTTSLGPLEDENEYYIKYGLGYAKYIHCCNSIEQNITVFVPKDDSTKINIIKLKNLLPQKRKLKLTYYIKNVLDEDEIKSNGYISLKFDRNSNCVIAKNIINEEFSNYMYVSSSEKINSYTGDKKEFFGEGNLMNPDGIKIDNFSRNNSLGKDSIVALNIEIEIEALEHKEISLVLGAESSEMDCKNISYKYSKLENCNRALENIIKYWDDFTSQVVITTPIDSINIMSNGWIIYQAMVSRILAKTGYYQSGGAIGFRDQLQDVLSMKYFNSEITKEQIIKQSKHQFKEGDVLHWWHEDTSRGIRTRFSDDLLWLPYAVSDYIEFTQDYSILDIETNYLSGDVLEENIDERYNIYESSDYKDSIYNHCIKAIDKSLNFGEHGLPKIGSGDWNDGFSNVGNKGRGESVWLGFFLYDVINRFIKLCEYKNDNDLIQKYKNVNTNLKTSLNNNCWDGRWYNRAFCDNGAIIGSIHNQECRIDGISQSWSVISGAGDEDKKIISMESLENHLIDRDIGIIKLLDPPFENGNINPGYIKSYLPGTRENGGQYTHAAVWAIIAEAILGRGDKAVELYKMINPIEHSKTKEQVSKYKIEPYVISADIYGHGKLSGQGGWSWYTGSASWYYICIIKYILGLRIENGELQIMPAIPRYWSTYSIKYKYGESIYNIKVSNPESKNTGVQIFMLNGEEVPDKKIKITNNGKVNEIEIIM